MHSAEVERESASSSGTTPAADGTTPSRRSKPREISANHLLNFQSSNAPGGGSRDRRRPPPPRRQAKTRYDRHKFLAANFRFLVSDAAVDIAKYEADPDLVLDWDELAAVEVSTAHPITCPITLHGANPPWITPCGHIFSAEAIMAHMMTQGGPELRASAACPLCAAAVAARELRTVMVREVRPLSVGDRVTLRLHKRARQSIIPEPADSSKGSLEAACISAPACNPFAKFTRVTNPMPLWERDAAALGKRAAQLVAEGGSDAEYEVPPVMQAMESLASRARAWTERRERTLAEQRDDVAGMSGAEEAGRAAAEVVKNAAKRAWEAEDEAWRGMAAAKALEAEFPALSVAAAAAQGPQAIMAGGQQFEGTNQSAAAAAEPAGAGALSPTVDENNFYYCYQSEDGQPIFLCALNMRMLMEWKGSFEALPSAISAPVLELEQAEQTEANRKRLRPLGHLPLGSMFTTCEIDISSILPAEAIEPFEAELSQRVKKRVQQAKQKARKQLREAARDAAAAAAAAAANSGPSVAELAAMPLPGASLRRFSDPVPVPGAEKEEDTGSDAAGSFPGQQPENAVSFARIARMGFAATGPALGEGSSGSSPPMTTQPPVWGSSPQGTSAWGAAQPLQPTWPAAVAARQKAAEGEGESGKGKKKGKKMLLLSTSQRRY